MKTTIQHLALTFTLIVVLTTQINARILTVANQTIHQTVAQYTTLQAAHDAAQSGDTIYLYPSSISYSGISITKKLAVIGAGFSKVTDFSDYSKILDTFTFDKGSEGSLISSINGNFKVNVKVNNIIIQKCKLKQIYIGNNLNKILISNSIITNYDNIEVPLIISDSSYVVILNNVIFKAANFGVSAIKIGSKAFGYIKNNVIIDFDNSYAIDGFSGNLTNDIIFASTHYYRFSADALVQNSSSKNMNNTVDDPHTYFVDYDGGNYHLKNGTSLVGAGTDGKDLGIYGGETPFIDDGTSSLPSIYYMNIPFIGSQKDGLSVEIKAKANK